jgi:release factor glutamine methyltransferase
MLTVLEALNSAVNYLQHKEIKSARLNAELLLSHILSCKRLELYLTFERPLQRSEIQKFRNLLHRRSKFEPLQYIIGNVEFYGLEFEINPSVLIPRPETELLVESVIESYQKENKLAFLDIGTGCGNIAIALAKNLSSSKVVGLDITKESIEIAKRNAKLNQVENRVMFLTKNIFNSFDDSKSHFDAVVSNPPYISKKDFITLDPELRLYEPRIALTDEGDGLSFYKKISAISLVLLKPNGKLFFEIGAGQSAKVIQILRANKYQNIVVKKDFAGIDRIIIGDKT